MYRLYLVLILLGPGRVSAWGPEGHNLVARLAAAHLSPAASAKVSEILGPGVSLASISSWADQVRGQRRDTGPWHYIDIPINQRHLDMTRDCPKGDCVIAKIEEFRKTIADPAASPQQRKEALQFLVHFIGDMHQPLHCSDNMDRGGNEVRLDFFGRNMNLHSVWDGGLLGRIDSGSEDALFGELSKNLTNGRAKKWGKGTVRDWAEQSHKAAVKIVYGKLPKAPAGGQVKITTEYEKLADPLVREQIERGGARLAAALNAALR
jgi:nuclease S1